MSKEVKWTEINRVLLPNRMNIVATPGNCYVYEMFEVDESAIINGIENFRSRIELGETFYYNDDLNFYNYGLNELVEWATIGAAAIRNLHRIIERIQNEKEKQND